MFWFKSDTLWCGSVCFQTFRDVLLAGTSSSGYFTIHDIKAVIDQTPNGFSILDGVCFMLNYVGRRRVEKKSYGIVYQWMLANYVICGNDRACLLLFVIHQAVKFTTFMEDMRTLRQTNAATPRRLRNLLSTRPPAHFGLIMRYQLAQHSDLLTKRCWELSSTLSHPCSVPSVVHSFLPLFDSVCFYHNFFPLPFFWRTSLYFHLLLFLLFLCLI